MDTYEDHEDTCVYCLSKCCKGDCPDRDYEPEPNPDKEP